MTYRTTLLSPPCRVWVYSFESQRLVLLPCCLSPPSSRTASHSTPFSESFFLTKIDNFFHHIMKNIRGFWNIYILTVWSEQLNTLIIRWLLLNPAVPAMQG